MIIAKIKFWASRLKSYVITLYLVTKDQRVSKLLKIFIWLIVAYAVSPIDLIPDFIPVIGWLDDLLILPIFIYVAIQMIPKQVWIDCQCQAEQLPKSLPHLRWASAVIILIWIIAACLVAIGIWSFAFTKK